MSMEFDLDALLAGIGDGGASVKQISATDYADALSALDALGSLPEISEDEAEPRERDGKREGTKQTRRRQRARARSLSNIAVLDFETDPFDNVNETSIHPFLAVLYSNNFEPIVIWEDGQDAFINAVIAAIEALPESYTIYAHNGGKFDYMFLIKRLRGQVMFKGRGIMTATVGKHELRDSYHIIPDRLANFKKDHIDYQNMTKDKRHGHKDEIIAYCISDCKYLLEIVIGFTQRFGMVLSIGQAAMADIRKHYKFERLAPWQDEFIRGWFFGGRVECLQGRVKRNGVYRLYDVNSMYPDVMANVEHPIGNVYFEHSRGITVDTIFIELTCWSDGAFVLKDEKGTHAPHGRHTFRTTIHEYNVAIKYDLIRDIEIHKCIDFPLRSKFDKFVVPHYETRQRLKGEIDVSKKAGHENTPIHDELIKDDMFTKFLLNNGYGKFAQNPRKYKENCFTDMSEEPEDGADAWGGMPFQDCGDYLVWQRPSPSDKFNNVATGASITGAARAKLLEAICNSIDPIYCDTDSLICKELHNMEIHKTKLGAWDIECEMSEVIVAGKKLYAYTKLDGNKKTKAKGSSALSYAELNAIYEGETILSKQKGVTLTKTGEQFYMKRRISATVEMDFNNGKSALWRGAKIR